MKAVYSGNIACSFTWTVEDFVNRPERKGDFLSSEIFEIYEPDGRITKWKILFFPKGEGRGQDGDISLFLSSLNNFDVKISYVMSILDETGSRQNSFTAKDLEFKGLNYGWLKFCSEKTVQENPHWFPKGNFTIACDTTIHSERIISKESEDPLSKKIHRQICEDLSNLFLDETTSDVQVKCGTKSFPCHRGILSARSPVFRAMLSSELSEKRDGNIDIKDFSPDVIEAMLKFMYASTVPSNDEDREHLAEVLKAADQYQLDLLKTECENTLCRGLKINNCLISLILGDMYQAEVLKRCSMKMLFENMNEVFSQSPEDWTSCVKSHPDLTVEITTEMARRQCLSRPNDTKET